MALKIGIICLYLENKMYRCGILLKNGERIVKNFPSKGDCDTFILETSEKQNINRAVILNKDNINERWVENF